MTILSIYIYMYMYIFVWKRNLVHISFMVFRVKISAFYF